MWTLRTWSYYHSLALGRRTLHLELPRLRSENNRHFNRASMDQRKEQVDMPDEIRPWRKIKLRDGYVCLVDAEDYPALMPFSWWPRISRRPDGSIKVVYACRTVNRHHSILMHRQLLGLAGSKPFTDHRNHNGLDNRRFNLRVTDYVGNARNQIVHRSNNTSGFKGIRKDGQNWAARIGINYRMVYLGSYPTPEEAARAYDQAALRHFGEFALLNFPRKVNDVAQL
jgi:hypothetical protein